LQEVSWHFHFENSNYPNSETVSGKFKIINMLLPQFEELLALRHQAGDLGAVTTRRVQTPLSGLYASVFRGQGMDFDEVREYQHGDEIRNIDWRVTARMNKPYLKVYREERERNVILCIDSSAYMQFGTRQTFKTVQAAKVAALLGWSAQTHADRVGGVVFGQRKLYFFPPSRSHKAFSQLLRHLTLPTPSDELQPTDLKQAIHAINRNTTTGALIFLILDVSQIALATLQQSLSQLHQRHELVLIGIDDPADSELPAVGLVKFIAPDGSELIVNTDNLSAKQHYHQLWLNHRQQVQLLVKQWASDFFSISTQEDVYQSLLTHLRQREKLQQAHR
jgi:uncharacterized protein (DUF58 family)